MRLILAVTALLAVGLAAPAHAAATPTVTSFTLSATGVVDTTNGDVPAYVDVSVSDAPGGSGISEVSVFGLFSPDTRPANQQGTGHISGFQSLPTPTSRAVVRIPILVPGGWARTWPLKLSVYTGDGQLIDLTPQLDAKGLNHTVKSKVTAAPKAPTGLKITKEWSGFPPFRMYVAYANWTQPATGPAAARNRTTGNLGCGNNDWSSESLDFNASHNASLIFACTATVRLVNDFGESAPVSASK